MKHTNQSVDQRIAAFLKKKEVLMPEIGFIKAQAGVVQRGRLNKKLSGIHA